MRAGGKPRPDVRDRRFARPHVEWGRLNKYAGLGSQGAKLCDVLPGGGRLGRTAIVDRAHDLERVETRPVDVQPEPPCGHTDDDRVDVERLKRRPTLVEQLGNALTHMAKPDKQELNLHNRRAAA